MKILRTIFAPFFWLRDIRDSLFQIESILRWTYCLEVRFSSLSTTRKKEILEVMLHNKERLLVDGVSAKSLLEVLELDD